MKKLTITLALLLFCNLILAQTQYEQGMSKALNLWKEAKLSEASALLERIAALQKNNWLPNYYITLIATTQAFTSPDKAIIPALLQKAQQSQDNATLISPNNPELMVTQAMIYTAFIVQDPMTNGQKYAPQAAQQYQKALALAPNNPRVVFCNAEFEMGSAKFWKTSTKPMCEKVAKSIDLFTAFKPETQFHPTWGLTRAQETLKNCQ